MSPSAAVDGGLDDAQKADGAEQVHSLGEALAGVTLGNSVGATFGSSQDPIARADSNHSSGGWGNFTDATSTSGAFSAPNTSSGRNDGLDLFLSQDPSKTLGDAVFKLSNPNLIELKDQHEKGLPVAVLDSQSSFRLHNTSGTAGDLRETLAPVRANSFGDGSTIPRGRGRTSSDSPACSVTGTTTSSRSVSPFANSSQAGSNFSNNDRTTIHSYGQRYDTSSPAASGTITYTDVLGRSVQSPHQHNLDDDPSSGGYSLNRNFGSHPSLATLDSQPHRSPYSTGNRDRRSGNGYGGGGSGAGSPYDPSMGMESNRSFGGASTVASDSAMMSPPPQMVHSLSTGSMQMQQQQPQVLYMAVPSPDGRGQVLQPVQMLQLPGKPYHFVSSVPGVPGAGQQQSPVQTVDSHLSNGPSMMVLPPLSIGSDHNQQPMSYASPKAESAESRSRIANYAVDANTKRGTQQQFSVDIGSPARDDFSVHSTSSPYPATGDSTIASLYAAPQRPPLETLLGQIRRLSRDQVGCRLVQQALDEEGPMAASMILNEGLPFWGEAMIDPFGNYLFQKILEKITAEERVMLVKSVAPRLVNASLNLHGTRSVQKVVELCATDEQVRPVDDSNYETAADILTQSLTPAAARLCIDSHGNHVIQRILLKLGAKHTKFVFDAVAASVGDVARHRHGCCVIQRCLDSPPSDSRSHLIDRIVDKSLELMQDAYGNYVVQYVLDVCAEEDVQAVCASVTGKVSLLAVQKFSSNVMEKCLERCSDRTREQYLHEMSDPVHIRELMMDPFGNYVVQRALSVATHAQAVHLVEAMRPHLTATQTIGPHGQRNGGVRNTAGGRRIIAKISRRFPNFSLGATGTEEVSADQYLSNKSSRHHQPNFHQQHHHQSLSSQVHHQNQHQSYVPMNVPPVHSQMYNQDPRMNMQGHMNMPPIQQQQQQQQQPQSYYNNIGMGGTSSYFDPLQFTSGGHTGFDM